MCTFRRPAVAGLLASLAKLELPQAVHMRVIVADNDDAPSARQTVTDAFAAHGIDGIYLHAPARNISIARNACLEAADAALVAFIDDDEIARPGWLMGLLAELDRSNADVVFGKVTAAYPPEAPAWMRHADLHSTPAPFHKGQIEGGYTCNVLMRREMVGGLRFDPAFGRSGGEDTTFFATLKAAGAAMAYTADAVVDEPVTPARSSLKWLTDRAYRSGQTYGLVRLARGEARFVIVSGSLAKAVWCWAEAAMTLWSPARWRRAAVRAHLHAGVMAAAMGQAPLELYGAASG